MRRPIAGRLPLRILVAGLVVFGVGAGVALTVSAPAPTEGLARNPNLDAGTPLDRPAPDFTLTDQFSRRVSLHSFRGSAVILAFVDSECTSVCPLTTTAMVEAKRLLGAAGRHVQLLGVDANPKATTVDDVRAYSMAHGMLRQWHFLTAPLPQLRRVWREYGIGVEIAAGQIDHTPALFEVDPGGRLRRVYLTQMSYDSVAQSGQLLAHEASALLPGHPRVHSHLSYAQVRPIGPQTTAALPLAKGGSERLAPGHARLLLFFATWDSEAFARLGARLEALDGYASAGGRLPPLVAIDEASVEASGTRLPSFLRGLRRRLSYPVAIDRSGRLADGYEVQDEPWFVLVSSSGRILWYHDVSTDGWPGVRPLAARVRAALAHVPGVGPRTAIAMKRALAGSPGPLAGLHDQAGELLGADAALTARLRALRGYPVVLNAWASWCPACQAEFSLFASASVRYGREVAFIGADTNDAAGNARAFLAQHPVGYPSYQASTDQLSTLAQLEGLPTTVFINRAGKVVYVHTGQYDAPGTLDQDIETYGLGLNASGRQARHPGSAPS